MDADFRGLLQSKLAELSCMQDEMFGEYIAVLLQNDNSFEDLVEKLQVFVDETAHPLAQWLIRYKESRKPAKPTAVKPAASHPAVTVFKSEPQSPPILSSSPVAPMSVTSDLQTEAVPLRSVVSRDHVSARNPSRLLRSAISDANRSGQSSHRTETKGTRRPQEEDRDRMEVAVERTRPPTRLRRDTDSEILLDDPEGEISSDHEEGRSTEKRKPQREFIKRERRRGLLREPQQRRRIRKRPPVLSKVLLVAN